MYFATIGLVLFLLTVFLVGRAVRNAPTDTELWGEEMD